MKKILIAVMVVMFSISVHAQVDPAAREKVSTALEYSGIPSRWVGSHVLRVYAKYIDNQYQAHVCAINM